MKDGQQPPVTSYPKSASSRAYENPNAESRNHFGNGDFNTFGGDGVTDLLEPTITVLSNPCPGDLRAEVIYAKLWSKR